MGVGRGGGVDGGWAWFLRGSVDGTTSRTATHSNDTTTTTGDEREIDRRSGGSDGESAGAQKGPGYVYRTCVCTRFARLAPRTLGTRAHARDSTPAGALRRGETRAAAKTAPSNVQMAGARRVGRWVLAGRGPGVCGGGGRTDARTESRGDLNFAFLAFFVLSIFAFFFILFIYLFFFLSGFRFFFLFFFFLFSLRRFPLPFDSLRFAVGRNERRRNSGHRRPPRTDEGLAAARMHRHPRTGKTAGRSHMRPNSAGRRRRYSPSLQMLPPRRQLRPASTAMCI